MLAQRSERRGNALERERLEPLDAVPELGHESGDLPRSAARFVGPGPRAGRVALSATAAANCWGSGAGCALVR